MNAGPVDPAEEGRWWQQRRQQERMNGAWEMLSGLLYAGQMVSQRPVLPAASLPLTVLSGFLGAGKTTLLNQLLAEPHGTRLAVLVNDFGQINIDARLIAARSANAIGLSNGCVCCSLAGDLTRTLIELTERSDPPEGIVLEASGLANPHGIIQVALANPALRLDGVVTLVDAETMREFAAHPQSGELFLSQLLASDLLVLNKTDLVEPPGRTEAREWLHALAPGRPIVEAVDAAVPAEIVLGVNRAAAREGQGAAGRTHLAGYESWSVSCDGLLDSARARQLLEQMPDSVLRAKGVLWLSDHPEGLTVYQRVGRRTSYVRGPRDGRTPASSLVLIGVAGSVAAPQLQQRLQACRIAAPAPSGDVVIRQDCGAKTPLPGAAPG